MHIDPKSSVPIYKQIVAELRAAIDAGLYKPGECLPSLRVMALEIHVNPNTVQRAYDELEREGIVESRRGVGVFVADRRQLTVQRGAEKRALRALSDVVRTALSEDVPIDRLRSLFEQTLLEARSKPGRTRP